MNHFENQYRVLGSTHLQISPIGLGTVKFGRNQKVKYPENFNIPTDKEMKKLLAQSYDWGINLLDTAPAYGNSEQRIASNLPNSRQDWVIVSKAGEHFIDNQSTYAFDQASIIKSVHQSLKHLKTDYIDILLIHSDGHDEEIIEKYEVFSTLHYLKDRGDICYFGMSCKTLKGAFLTNQYADVAMLEYSPVNDELKPALDDAANLKKGILVKKALASGHLHKITGDNPIQQSMNFVLSHTAVHSIIVGTINPKHLKENILCAAQAIHG